jgi:hypothetical protein
MAGYPAPETGPWSAFASLRVYFDSGVHPPGSKPPAFVKLGYSVCLPEVASWKQAISSAASVCEPGKPVAFWGLKLRRLTPEHRAVLAKSAAGRGPQLYDLVAAHGAAVGLRANGFHGSVAMLTDGSEVIQFMNGNDSRLHLTTAGVEFSQDLRLEIRETLERCALVTWQWIPRRLNLADAAIRHLLRTLVLHQKRALATAHSPAVRRSAPAGSPQRWAPSHPPP